MNLRLWILGVGDIHKYSISQVNQKCVCDVFMIFAEKPKYIFIERKINMLYKIKIKYKKMY